MRIAIIGGIGSGKSEVLAVAKELGFTTLSADKINEDLLNTPEYIEKIAEAFPNVVDDGAVDKAALSAAVFGNKEKRELLNCIAHPEILKKIDECTADPLVVELPLALESGMLNCFDQTILVKAAKRVRLIRLEGRGVTKKRARSIMRAQVPVRKLEQCATLTIENNGDLNSLREASRQVLRIFGE